MRESLVLRRSPVLAVPLLVFSTAAFAIDPPAPIEEVEIVETQIDVFTGGITQEEYLDRQAALNVRLQGERPAGTLDAQLVVPLTPDQLNTLLTPGSTNPLQIGIVVPVAPNVQVVGLNRDITAKQARRANDGVITRTPDGSLTWAMAISSPGAGAIRLHLENLSLPANGELYFYSLDGQAFGPYTAAGPHSNGEFWSETIFGDQGILQLQLTGRTDDATLRGVTLSLTELGHIGAQYTGLFLQNTAANWPCGNPSCVEDATCNSGAASSIWNAYAKMEWIAGAFIYTCTTALLTDTNPNADNFALTANHCISRNRDAQNINFYWRYRTSSCNGTCPTNNGWPYQTGGGATVSATGSGSDFTLLHLNNAPPSGSTLLGWTTTAVANSNGVALHRVSNPNFGPQVYSEQHVDTSRPTCSGLPRGSFIYSSDDFGATDGGSSGSPVVNASNQVVGQLYGSCGFNVGDPCDSAANATVDGAFAASWPSLQPHLAPTGGCFPTGTSCTSNSQCCSNSCKGPPGGKTCK